MNIISKNGNLVVVCMGPRRSGSTLQFNLARKALERAGLNVLNLGYLPKDSLESSDLATTAGFNAIIVKTHDSNSRLPKGSFILACSRDIRDIYVSLRLKCNNTIDDIPMIMGEYEYSTQNLRERDHVLLQTYENLFFQQDACLNEIADFLNIELKNDEIIEPRPSLLNRCSSFLFLLGKRFYSCRRKTGIPITKSEVRIKSYLYFLFLKRSTDKSTQMHPNHISKNKGQPGAWKTSLSKKELQAFKDNGLNFED